MKRLMILTAATALSSPALAQHQGHTMPMPAPKAQPEAKKTPPKAAPAPQAAAPATPAADPHAGHSMDSAAPPPQQPADPHAGHDMSATPQSDAADPMAGHDMGAMPQNQAADPMTGHDMSAMPQSSTSDPMAGHDMSAMGPAASAPPVAPPPPEAFAGPEHAATTIFDPQLFLRKREEELIEEHGGYVTWMFLADQLEYRINDGRDGYKWDIQGWYGGDYDKLWIKSEGEGAFGESPEQAEVQALYSRAIDPWFNLQAGIRHDFRPDPERTHLVVGIQGLARYWFEVDGALFLSDKGDLTARFEAEYDQRITQKLILQPAVEFDLAAQDVPEIGVGSGLSTAEIGLRLRYEFVPELAPYIGLEYERAFGDTADFRRAAAEDVGGWSLLLGVRAWF